MAQLYYEHRIIISLQVHDELNGSLPDVETIRTVKRVMQNCVRLEIPVVAETKKGPSWGECKSAVELLSE
jgi:DNA polymerase I-like protein with 3'-5' exonuclease and polymerase domains